MKKNSTLFITQASIIAALYLVLTMISNSLGLAFGPIQVRLSEMLTILPYFTPAAIPGLFIGCLFSNILLGGACLVDIVFGSLTTLLAAYISYKLRKNRYLVSIPPVVFNAITVPLILHYGYGLTENSIPFLIMTVGLGQLISCTFLGTILQNTLSRNKLFYIISKK